MVDIIFVGETERKNVVENTYRKLNKEYDILFIFKDRLVSRLSKSIKKELNLRGYKERRFFTNGFMPKILKHVLKDDYKVWATVNLGSFPTLFTYPLAKLRRKKYLLYGKNWYWQKTIPARILKPYLKHIIKNSDAIIAHSTKAKKFFIENGADRNKIFAAPRPIEDYRNYKFNQNKIKKFRRRYNPENKTVLLHIGRVISCKGLDILIKSIKSLNRKDFLLLVVGGDNTKFGKYCKNLAGNDKRIKFVGKVDKKEIPYFYKISDMYVHPNKFVWEEFEAAEAWGSVLNEAISLSLPVIVTNATGSSEDLVIDKKTGYIIQENNVKELKSRIKYLLDNPEKRKEMGREGKKHLIDNITVENQYKAYKEAIDYALKK